MRRDASKCHRNFAHVRTGMMRWGRKGGRGDGTVDIDGRPRSIETFTLQSRNLPRWGAVILKFTRSFCSRAKSEHFKERTMGKRWAGGKGVSGGNVRNNTSNCWPFSRFLAASPRHALLFQNRGFQIQFPFLFLFPHSTNSLQNLHNSNNTSRSITV